MDSATISRIAQQVSLPENSVAATIALFERGATVPFIARYRKEMTGDLDGRKILEIQERMLYYRDVQDRRAVLLRMLAEQNRLTDELRQYIDGLHTKVEIEDLFQLFRPNRRTRATQASEKGLEPLAEYLWNQEADAWSLEEHADVYINPEKGITSREQALQGAVDIIAEWISENLELRRTLRETLWKGGVVVSTVVPAKAGQKTKYTMYYNRREPVTTIPSHRVLAIRRGTKEGVLTSAVEGDNSKALDILRNTVIRDKDSPFAGILEIAVRESYNRILRPLIETEVRALLKERADREAIHVFQDNLLNLLLSPPGGRMIVMGIDPGKGEECKLAVADETGKLLEESTISPMPPKNDIEGARTTLRDLISRHNVQALALGGGTAARALEVVLRQILAEERIDNVFVATVNDAAVTIYSSSRVAREELPDLSTSARCAVSLARRLQDPLSELVKLDPKLIGVGQYQHDVDQRELHRSLIQTVQWCVNKVGVDPNVADHSVLRYVSGLNDRLARKIIAARSSAGRFPSRAALLSVPGMDAATFEQAAGFLRIRDGEHPLDRTAIHSQSYPVVERMASALGVTVAELVGNRDLISTLKLEDFVTEGIGLATLQDIREELLTPGRDPRKKFEVPKFRADVKDIGDLKEGMTLEGVVTNVTNFGAFVDIGVHQDGLVHLSQMSNRFIRDPREAVKVGDIVQVKVISIEVETKRIGLSMKALMPVLARRRKKFRHRVPRGQDPSAATPTGPAPEANQAEARSPESIEGAPRNPVAAGSPDRGDRRRRRRPRPRWRTSPQPETQSQNQEAAAKREIPEPSLQEKIAILQSKFRGLS